jgi:hypothetical protein
MAFVWGWLSDGPCRGARWPFIYFGALLTVSCGAFVSFLILSGNSLTTLFEAHLQYSYASDAFLP